MARPSGVARSLAEELEAVHDRHHEVEEDEGGAAAGDLAEGGAAVLGPNAFRIRGRTLFDLRHFPDPEGSSRPFPL